MQEIFAPVENVYCDRLLRPATLQGVQIQPRAKLVAQVELLTHPYVGAGSYKKTNGARTTAAIVCLPGPL